MIEIIESSHDELLVECSSLSPLLRSDLQAFLERQSEVQRVSLRLRVTDALLNPDTLGLISPRFELVVPLVKDPRTGIEAEEGLTGPRSLERSASGCKRLDLEVQEQPNSHNY